jgi:hypothetical protein
VPEAWKVYFGSKDLYGALSVKAALGSFHLIVRHAGDHLLVPTGFDGQLGAVTVKGGRRPSRSDVPLTVTSKAAGLLGREAGFPNETSRSGRSFPDGSVFATMTIEGSSPSGARIAPQTCIRSIRGDRDHDAVMRIGGEAPGRRAHSKPRLKGHSPLSGGRYLGSSSAGQGRSDTDRPKLSRDGLRATYQAAGRRRRPAGASPRVASRQSTMRSLRASATTMVLRVPPRASAVRLRYHSANGLPF